MAKSDWPVVGFRMPEIQRKKLNRMLEESDEYDDQQDFLHQLVLDEIRDVEFTDPRDELEDIRQQKKQLRDEIEEVVAEVEEMRNQLGELEERESELQAIAEDYNVTSAESYEESVREAANEIIRDELKVSERWERVQHISEKWQQTPIDVLRDIYEQDPRLTSKQVKPYGRKSVPEDWQTRVGDTREEGVRLVRLYCEESKDKEWNYRSGVYIEDEYVSRVAEEHGTDCESLLREAAERMDETFEDIVYLS
ncbi:hypothetical protein [Natrinema salaciae]|nr:hypothetical protein [Natrinema salaciae]